MPTTVQFRRGTTAQNDAFTGAAGELSIDTDKNAIRVHDNSTAGGEEVVVVSATQTLTNKTLTAPNLTSPTIGGTAIAEYISDTVGAMVSSNTESGISVTYQDADNTLDFDVGDFDITLTGAVTGSGTVTNLGNVSITTTATNDPTITLAGDLSGSATLTNLGSATLTATIVDDSHNHIIGNVDGLQTALDAKLALAGGTMSGAIAMGTSKITGMGDPTAAQDAATKAYVDSGLSSLSSTTLTEGNSTLVVADSGTGTITATIDGATHSTFAAAGITLAQGEFIGDVTGNADTADAWSTARTLSLTGAVTGSASIDGSGNVSLATTATSDPTITLAGDLSGSATLTNLGNATLTATIAANSVALGTDTTGNYIAGISGGTGVSVSGSGAESATATISIGQAVATSSNVTFNNLTLSGDLTVNGTTTTVATTNTVISDNLIELNNGAGSNANDSGIVIERGSTGDNAFIGWDESADKFVVGTTTATGASTGDLTITTGTLVANIEGDVTGNADTASAWQTSRTLSLTGAVTGSASIDGSGNVSIATTNTADPVITLTGAVTGSGTMTNLGSVSIATTATADPTITLAGDLSGSATLTNLGSATLTATIAANSVALGTDTTGNYMAGVSAGSGISVSHTPAEGSTATVSHADTSSVSSLTALTGANVVSDLDFDTYGHVTLVSTRTMTLADLGYSGATNANYITNNNQLTNGAGYTTNTGDITNVAVSGTGLSGGGASGSVTITSNATSANTGSTIVARDGSGNFSAGVITATTTAARYADLAERYTADADYEPGTVLVFGGEAEVTQTTSKYDRRIAGIVSTDPAFLMNESLEDGVSVGLVGRLPCKVVGEVRKGDLMVASDTAGHAEAWRDESNPPAGSVIGKALENKTGAGADVIEVVVGKI